MGIRAGRVGKGVGIRKQVRGVGNPTQVYAKVMAILCGRSRWVLESSWLFRKALFLAFYLAFAPR